MPPLISCLMITQANRLSMFRRAVQDFENQTYPAKELVVVTSSPPAEMEANMETLFQLRQRCEVVIRQLPSSGGQLPLGVMRNCAIDAAHGDYFCTWDDDDRHHCHRLQVHYDAMQADQSLASVLNEQMHYFSHRAELYLVNWSPGLCPGIICFKRGPWRYREDATRGEDNHLFKRLKQVTQIAAVQGRPELYLRYYHGSNCWSHAHHTKLVKRKLATASAIAVYHDKLAQALREFGLRGPVSLQYQGGVYKLNLETGGAALESAGPVG